MKQAGLGPYLKKGLRILYLAIDTHLITAHYALPLMIERPGGLLSNQLQQVVETLRAREISWAKI